MDPIDELAEAITAACEKHLGTHYVYYAVDLTLVRADGTEVSTFIADTTGPVMADDQEDR